MGCTPSKSVAVYSQDRVCRDLDTCSTFVASVKSAMSTPERPSPRLRVETKSGKQTLLSVPCQDIHGRSLSQFGHPAPCSSPDPLSCTDLDDMKPCSSRTCTTTQRECFTDSCNYRVDLDRK